MVMRATRDRPIRVLLIEDSPTDARLIRQALASVPEQTVELVWAKQLSIGLGHLGSGGIDVVLLDLTMPDSRGLETLVKVRARAPAVPVVVLVQAEEETLGTWALREGAAGYVVKNRLTSQPLLPLLHHAMERHHLWVELQHTLQQLELSKRQFHTLAEHNADGIVVVDQEGRLRYVNPAAQALLQRKEEKLIDEPFGFPVISNEETEIEVLSQGGEPRTVQMRVIEIRWQEEEEEEEEVFLVLLRDVTERKQIEEALRGANEELRQLNASKDEFISSVSHELRTPLAITREGISLVLDGVPGAVNEKQHHILIVAQASIDRLTRLITNLLDMSKLEAGKAAVCRGRVDLKRLMQHVADTFASQINAKGLTLTVNVPQEAVEVYADADKITQVLTNLVGNALKFTERGSIELTLRQHEQEAECLVADTGMGISKEDLPKVFGKFQQFPRAPGGGEQGVGLGLAITKGLIELHHGTIQVESEIGRGTTLTFTLPLYAPQRALEESFRDLVEAATRSEQKSVGLIVIDTAESETGEQVAQLVRDHLHQYDVVLSLEPQWVVMLALADAHGVQAIVQRLRTVLREWAATQGEGTTLPSPVRMGAALYPVDGNDVHRLFAEATGSLNRGLAAPSPTPHASAPTGGGRSRKKRIVVADDDPAFLDVMTLRLEHEGYEVVRVTDGEDVLQRATAQEEPVDLILLDLNMPKLNGSQVCRELKTHPASAAIPIIVITGVESYQARLADLCVELGAIDGLVKPIRSAELLEKVHRALGEKG